ncbi:hypothetical protein KNO15_08925 [Leifsonia shinshuensis]|uniref:hypothetical protein n=1 Tax=Leifsonia shinshuensis TaxID=150026 RepID=UPI001F507C86|nr:hypothetical protein [Leifsonia shinshuensis]MCI0156818.1 hypothetical protein [Leifsonia shinshuensis]
MTLDRIPDDQGRYRVTTRSGSVYVFDLSSHTVTRTPGERSHHDIWDGMHQLRMIIQGQVGTSGFWTLEPDSPELDEVFDYLWQVTSPIIAIEAIIEE